MSDGTRARAVDRLKAGAPWRAKFIVKIVAGQLPLGYSLLRRLGLGVHGSMDDAAYAVQVFERHFRHAPAAPKGDLVVMELGPGDSVGSAFCARAHGATETWLIDAGPYARSDVATYRPLIAELRSKGLACPEPAPMDSLHEMLEGIGARYRTDGIASLGEISDDSVDLVFSQAVLEHVARDEFDDLMAATFRCLRPGGVASHRVDLQDHLGHGLNNLRYSDRLWESRLIRKSGFYTNRLRYAEVLDSLRLAGFEIELVSSDRWDSLPTARRHMARRFAELPDEDLLIKGFDVVARKPGPRRAP